jgi:hypothetical protein
MDDGQQVSFPIGQLLIVIADKQQNIFIRLQGDFMEIRSDVFRTPMNRAKGIGGRLRLVDFLLALFFAREFPHGEVAPTLD